MYRPLTLQVWAAHTSQCAGMGSSHQACMGSSHCAGMGSHHPGMGYSHCAGMGDSHLAGMGSSHCACVGSSQGDGMGSYSPAAGGHDTAVVGAVTQVVVVLHAKVMSHLMGHRRCHRTHDITVVLGTKNMGLDFFSIHYHQSVLHNVEIR